jgi:Domain of unknown function (DUF5655)
MTEPLWVCPACERAFANRQQTHTCAPLGDMDTHFKGTDPWVRQTFDHILETVRESGPVLVLAEKTRIALQVRISFAAFVPRKKWLNGHLVLAHRVDSPRFYKVEVYSPRNVVHAFRLHAPEEVDAEFGKWLSEAYRVGEQQHLTS